MRSLKESVISVNGLLGAVFVAMTAALFLVFVYVPTDREMGAVQRIFYFHVPLAWIAFLAFAIVFVCSIAYLRAGSEKWHRIARSSAEIGFLFTTLVLITGPIWAKPVWGTWWTWDARLTTTLILWFIYIGYLVVGSYTADESRGARFSAVIGIVGFLDVPVVALAIVLWRTQHPEPLVFEGGLAGSMLFTLLVCLGAFTLLFVYLLVQRSSIAAVRDEVKRLRRAVDEMEHHG
jgi:heme exporter protein C